MCIFAFAFLVLKCKLCLNMKHFLDNIFSLLLHGRVFYSQLLSLCVCILLHYDPSGITHSFNAIMVRLC